MFKDFENPTTSSNFSAMDIVIDLTPSQVTDDDEDMYDKVPKEKEATEGVEQREQWLHQKLQNHQMLKFLSAQPKANGPKTSKNGWILKN